VTEIIGSGLAFPLQVDRRGGIALARDEQDIEQAIQLILGTAPGERPMRPEFGCGVHDFVFDSIDANTIGHMEQAIRDALARWEPRIEVKKVSFDATDAVSGLLTIDITYEVRATNTARNLVYPFYVIPAEETE
jgi:phage baseplate assembly protein W